MLLLCYDAIMAQDTVTIALKESTVKRLRARQPFVSMTYDEVITELLDETDGGEKRVVAE